MVAFLSHSISTDVKMRPTVHLGNKKVIVSGLAYSIDACNGSVTEF